MRSGGPRQQRALHGMQVVEVLGVDKMLDGELTTPLRINPAKSGAVIETSL